MSQNAQLDSLAALLETDIPDSTRYYIFTQVIWGNSITNGGYALQLNDDLKSMGIRANNPDWIRQAQYYYGVIYKNTGDFIKARDHMDTVYHEVVALKDTTMIAYSSYQLAVISKLMDQYDEALSFYNIAEEYYRYLNNSASIGMTMNSRAGVYRSMKLYDKAIEEYNRSLNYHLELKDSIGLANVYANIGNYYAEIDSLDLALEYYRNQEIIAVATGNEYNLGFLYENRGRVYNLLGLYDRAIASLKKSIEMREKFDNKDVLATTWIQLADVQMQKGLINETLKSVQNGYSIALSLGLTARLKEAYDIYADIYARQGNYKLAYYYNLKSEAIKDSLLNEKIVEQSLKIDALTDYENLQREQQISLLSAQSELKDLKISQANRNLWLSLLGLLGISIITYLIYNSRQKTKRLYDELAEKQVLLQKTLADKDYLLREIHHRVKNNLQVISSLLKLQSASVTDERAQQALDEGRNRVRSMALIHQNLYQDGKQLGGLNVREYFEQLTEELFESYKADKSEILLSLDIQDMILDVDTVVPMGLMINELVSNSLKYAFVDGRGGRISVSLKETADNTLILKVADDGPGYDESMVNAKSFGHKLVRAFAERLNADYDLSTKDGVYSTFTIKDYRKAA